MMNVRSLVWQVVAVSAICIFAWMFRYDVHPGSNFDNVVKFDRWTGNVWHCIRSQCVRYR